MKVTIKPVLWKHKLDKDGRAPIALAIRGGGDETYHNTGVKIFPDNWNGAEITKKEENYDRLNAKLLDSISSTKKEILHRELQGETITLDLVKKLLKPDSTGTGKRDFFKYAEAIIEGKNAATKRRYTAEITKLKEYAKNSLFFGEITPKWLTAYYEHLLKKNHPNTAINAFKVIRHVFNEAIEQKHISYYPFAEWKYPQYKAPKRQYLTTDECDKLYKLLFDTDVEADLKLVIAFCLLEAYSGIRVSDWGKFEVEKVVKNNDMIFTTTKTGTPVRLPLDLMPSLNKIVNYIKDNKLRWTYTGEFANRQLKAIRTLAKINKHLHTHIFRHTYATQSLSIGMSKESIAMAMGITSKQVETYAKLTGDKLRNELTRLGGGI